MKESVVLVLTIFLFNFQPLVDPGSSARDLNEMPECSCLDCAKSNTAEQSGSLHEVMKMLRMEFATGYGATEFAN